MFKIVDKDTIKWPVTVHVPADGGRTHKHTFDAEFKVLNQEEIDAALEDSVANCLRRVIIDWEGVSDEAGNEITFSENALSQLLGIPYVRQAMFEAWLESTTGGRRKN